MKVLEIDKTILERPINHGAEAKIYADDNYLYKIFNFVDDKMLSNKIEKLKLLHELNLDVKPLYFVALNSNIIGYSMDKKYIDYKPLNSFDKNVNRKLDNLKKLKDKLDILHNQGIIYGDLKLSNVLEHNGDVVLCDIDNVKIDEYDFDTFGYLQNLYLKAFEADIYLDNYMFNALAISYLNHVVESYTVDYADKKGLPYQLNTRQNQEILASMIDLKDKEKIKPFIKNLKRYHF